MLSENLRIVRDRIAAAEARAGRPAGSVTLIAVTKTVAAEAIAEAHALGVREFGENYVQEYEGKFPAVSRLNGARVHLIGHLQSNKSKRAAELFSAVDTVDSPKLARRLNECGRPLDVMVEVKLSAEDAKAGCAPEDLAGLVAAIRACPNLTLTGFMTMPPWSDDPEQSRPYFARLAALAGQHGVTGLSMGMSHDLDVAIAEGATYVRVGTALFGKRMKP